MGRNGLPFLQQFGIAESATYYLCGQAAPAPKLLHFVAQSL